MKVKDLISLLKQYDSDDVILFDSYNDFYSAITVVSNGYKDKANWSFRFYEANKPGRTKCILLR